MSFAELLDAVDELQVEEQVELVEIVRHRLSERRRDQLAAEIRQARSDFDAGICLPMTPDEILRNILS